MRFKKLKMGLASGMMAVMVLASAGSAFASDSKSYEVNYQKGAPTTVANPSCTRTLVNLRHGFSATSPTFNGSGDRKVVITESGVTRATINIRHRTPSWSTNCTSGYCTLKITGYGSASCVAKGTVTAN